MLIAINNNKERKLIKSQSIMNDATSNGTERIEYLIHTETLINMS